MKLIKGGRPPFEVLDGGLSGPARCEPVARVLFLVRNGQVHDDPQTPQEFLACDRHMTSAALQMMLDTATVQMENWWANVVLRLFIPDEERADPNGTRLLVCAMVRLTSPQGAHEASHLRALQTADWCLKVQLADGPSRLFRFVQPVEDGKYVEDVVERVGLYSEEAVLRRVFALRQRDHNVSFGMMYQPSLLVTRLMLERMRGATRAMRNSVPASQDTYELCGLCAHGEVITFTVPLVHLTHLWTE